MAFVEFHTREQNGVCIISVTGQVDLYNMGELKTLVAGEMEKGHFNILINLEKMDYIDSSGISVLITTFTALKNKGGALLISNVQPSIHKIFDMTKLNAFFKIFPTEQEALSSL